jgi:hypothetical protein
MATVPASKAKTKFGGRNLADVRRAAEGLESLQKEIAKSSKGKKTVSWKEFRAAVEEGRK